MLTINGGRSCSSSSVFTKTSLRIERLLDELLAAGYWPVVAHLERYYGLQRMPNYLYDWVNRGVVLQVNKGSPFGRFGRGAQALAEAMLTHRARRLHRQRRAPPGCRTPELLSAWDNLPSIFPSGQSSCSRAILNGPAQELLPAGRFRPFF